MCPAIKEPRCLGIGHYCISTVGRRAQFRSSVIQTIQVCGQRNPGAEMDQDLTIEERQREGVCSLSHNLVRNQPRGFRLAYFGARPGALKVTLEDQGHPSVAELEPGGMRAASLPCRQMGPGVVLATAGRLRRGGGASCGFASCGFARPWAGSPAGAAGAGLTAGGRGFPLSGDLRGAGRDSRGCRSPPIAFGGRGSPSGPGGRGSLSRPGGGGGGGAVGVGLRAQRPTLGSLSRSRAEAPPSVPRPPIPPPPPPSRSSPRLRPRPPPPALREALPGVPGGCPGGAARRGSPRLCSAWFGGAGKGEESCQAAQHFQRAAGERAARREGGGLAPARPERSLLFPGRSLHAGTVTAAGGEDGGAGGGGE